MNKIDISQIRTDYKLKSLDIDHVVLKPLVQLQLWLNEAISAAVMEPTAFLLSTVSKETLRPSSRVVLLKGITEEGCQFFTNYKSRKGMEIDSNSFVAINFFWPELERQVRVEGKIQKVSADESDNYYNSRPYLGDENFERSVVLICENNEDGSVGFIFNQPTELTVDAVLTNIEVDCKELLYIGGPVQQDSLHFIYRNHPILEESIEITEGLYWGGDFEQLLSMINNHSVNLSDFRFFLGYSGWAPGQLKEELDQNSWMVGKPDIGELFDIKPSELWRTILRGMGGKYKMYSNYPIDPKLN